jgi:exodeoxyribonuclease VII small subunit
MDMTMAKTSAKHADVKEMSFERALKELEGIVNRLERGDVELEESIAIYERGEVLKEHCDRLLKQAEAKVEKLTFAADGTPKGTEPLDPQGK